MSEKFYIRRVKKTRLVREVWRANATTAPQSVERYGRLYHVMNMPEEIETVEEFREATLVESELLQDISGSNQ